MVKATKSDKNVKEEQELIDKVVWVRRVTKVVKGGKNLRFTALMVVGDGKGQVGFGAGKAREVPDAVRKATEQAKRSMIRIPLREGRTLHHDVKGTFGAGSVVLRMAPAGTGIIAGGPMRAIFEALGIQDVVSKSVGTSNYYNVVRATFNALTNMTSPRQVAVKLGRKVPEIVARRDAALARR
ncbi:MAG: ribosomal protein [Alphaproteobacteria bacterium]|jgi:small subunit ribosomal protein S5|nr:ribosomal protein [Alphaproteobacteria bacterium]